MGKHRDELGGHQVVQAGDDNVRQEWGPNQELQGKQQRAGCVEHYR